MASQNLLRSVIRGKPRSLTYRYQNQVNAQRRTLASTVLLSKSYEDRTVVELRDEARKRGLPVSGNKATLITRIQTDDSHNVQDKVAPTPIQSRSASSSAPVAEPVGAKVPHPHPTPAPIDEAAIRSKFIHPVLDIHLPNLSQPEPEIQVQVPFVPDFWESSKTHEAESTPSTTPQEPKIVVTSGESTHHGGGPSHNLYPYDYNTTITSDLPSSPQASDLIEQGGLVHDFLSDLNLSELRLSPKPDPVLEKEMKESLSYNATTPEGTRREYSRALDEEEKAGLWVIGGIIGGGWLLGWLSEPSREVKGKDKAKATSH